MVVVLMYYPWKVVVRLYHYHEVVVRMYHHLSGALGINTYNSPQGSSTCVPLLVVVVHMYHYLPGVVLVYYYYLY